MISDERREVAARLRETCDEIKREGNGLTVWELADVLNIRDDDSVMTGSLNLDDARHLADLIDRQTCHKVIPSEMEGYVFCSKCGAEIGEYGVPNYCHNCGAEVVE